MNEASNDTTPETADFGSRLAAVEGSRGAVTAQAILELSDREAARERRLRRATILCWSIVFAMIPVIAVMAHLARTGSDYAVELGRSGLVAAGLTGATAMLLGLITLLAWLVRPRAASLAAIDQRLRALEQLLR